jgi:hypothetical protein
MYEVVQQIVPFDPKIWFVNHTSIALETDFADNVSGKSNICMIEAYHFISPLIALEPLNEALCDISNHGLEPSNTGTGEERL